jgi:hypothetical protein
LNNFKRLPRYKISSDTEGVKVRQRATITGVAIGAATSLALMLRAGRHQRSIVLILLFAVWVLSPFVALVYAHLNSKQWLTSARTMLYGLTVAVVFTCPAIYADVAFGRTTLKVGFVFLVVPFLCCVLIGFLVCIALFSSRKESRQGDGNRQKLGFPH